MWCRICSRVTDQEQTALMSLEKLLPEQYSHTVCSYEATGDNSFRAAIKLKLSSEEEAKRWLEDFQSSSGFTWRVSKTYPNGGRYNKYRVDYRCQRNTFGCSRRTMNTSCPATLYLILKRHPECGERKSRSGDPHMKEGLFLHINLRNEHNHGAYEAVTRCDVSGETIEKLKKLFESGHSPSSALDVLKYDLQEEEQDNYVYAAADRSVCPDLQFCYRLYYKQFKKAHSAAAGEELFKDLEQTLDDYNKEQGDVCARMCKTSDNQLVIAICTPMMKRVHARLRESSEMVFVDSSGNCERNNHRLFLLLTHSSAGGLPLGVFITTSQSQPTLSAAIELLQTVLPPERFFGHPEGPLVVMTDDCSALRQALHEAYPEATLVLCVFRVVLQAMWRWLWSSSNDVLKQHRAHLLRSFRSLVYASTPAALMEVYTRLREDHVASQHPKFVQHLQEVFQRREEWAICLHVQLPTRGNHTNNYVESAMRVVKEKVLHQLKAYNVRQLVDFVFTRMEAHYIRRLTDVANNRLQTSLKKVLETEDIGRYSIVQEDQDNYTVTSSSNAAVSYHVDMAIGCCTCPVGFKGGHCKHQTVVARVFGHNDAFLHGLSLDTQKLYNQIATGERPIKERLNRMFLDITKKLDNPHFTHSITSFVKTYENIKTDSAMVSALSSFGKSLPTKARGCKRQRGYLQTCTQIGRHPTALSRRKTSLGGIRVLSSRRPPKALRKEHAYGRTVSAPHSIAHCVEESMCH
ncbi:uncharacterized protein si:dkey-75a21.2 [Morone saxatilis]|uniref:uncharacterized protein si:dkey-75a21.2 n=1 Tax=Morone saxatilis TaxID=34816 RepID=UPI0015E1BB38|nr:uncharacterized protein si:dkey-75a21.2 [Morone saxatilis]